jgi:hypothetical protein
MLRVGTGEYRQCHGAIQVSEGSPSDRTGLHEEHPSHLPDKSTYPQPPRPSLLLN